MLGILDTKAKPKVEQAPMGVQVIDRQLDAFPATFASEATVVVSMHALIAIGE